MLKTRVVSAVIGIPVLLALLFAGGLYWKAFILLLGILALYEFYQMMSNKSFKPLIIPGYLFLFLLLFSHLYSLYLLPGILFIIGYIVIVFVIKYPQISILDISLSFWGAAYIGFLLNYAIRMADLEQAFPAILLTLLLTWSSDIGGYFFGSKWGKHKMAPSLSPGKSWQGALGAILLSIIVSYIFLQFLEIEKMGLAYLLVLAITSSIMAQFGDLFISGAKRYFAVKDSGHIIPGHGGVLDRFDSFLLVVPLVYYFFLYMV